MNKRLICQMAGAFILGVAAANFPCVPVIIAAGVYGIACFFWNVKPKRTGRILLLILFFAAGAGRFRQQDVRLNAYAPLLMEDQSALVQGEIYQKESKNDRYTLYLKSGLVQINQINYSCNQIIVYLDTESYSIGETICVKGKIKPFQKARNEGNFDAASYYRSLNIDFSLEAEEVLGVYGKKDQLGESLLFLKEKLKKCYTEGMEESKAGVCLAMVLGDKSVLDGDIKELYQSAGISHILAISGLHISMIGMASYLFLRKCGLSFFAAGIVAGLGILCYGQMTGFGISEKRAIFMFLLLLYARFRGRAYDLSTTLALVAALMLYQNPFLLQNAGFLLSFSAVTGIGVFQNCMILDKGHRDQKGYRRKQLRETFGMSIFIQLMTIPLLASFFYQIPLYAMLINLLVLPLMGALLGFALAGGILGCLHGELGRLLLFPCHVILEIYERLCEFFGELPGAGRIIGQPTGIQLLTWYLLFAAVCLLLSNAKGEKGKFLIPVAAFAFFCILAYPKNRGFEMVVLDVGQGDGIYLQTESGAHIFVDGGSSSVSKVGKYRILPFLKSRAIQSIDYWFVSHADLDHVSGLKEILASGYPIRHLVVANAIPTDEAYEELQEAAEESGAKIIKMKQGDSLSGEAGNKKEFSIQCIFPDDEYQNPDRNAKSMVLLYQEEDFSAIFTGDISIEEEKRLLAQQILPEITVYKAAHHGSKFSNSIEFLQRLSPEISVISCGERNRYGHPAKEAVEHMKEAGGMIYETRYLGEIRITKDGKVRGFVEE